MRPAASGRLIVERPLRGKLPNAVREKGANRFEESINSTFSIEAASRQTFDRNVFKIM